MTLRNLAAAAAVLMAATVGQAGAQQDGAFSDQQLDNYVLAYLAVQDIVREFQVKADAAGEEADVENLKRVYGEHIERAITANNLSLEEYGDISNAVSTDPDLQQTMMDKFREVRGNPE